jgi:cytochrome c oxidase subunit III
MTGRPSHLAHQFADAAQQHLAAKLGMWAFLATEVLFFGGLFTGYAVYWARYPEAWAEASRHLGLGLGAINTAVLLASSLTMAFAVDAARTNERRATVRHLMATIVLALIFLGIKGWEYADKWQAHLVPGDQFAWHGEQAAGPVELFFSLYFAMTGCHALHMVIGVVVLGVLCWQAGRGAFSADYHTPVEMTGLYWHFVDCVWVVLFPLLYLIDRT